MSTTDGAGTPKHDEEARVVQIYPRHPLETEVYCPLQVSLKDTVEAVIRNAVVSLDLDSSQTYSLLEVRENGSGETQLDHGDCPLLRVLLWPPEAQRFHPRSQGYYFILQQSSNGAKHVGTAKEESDDLCNLSPVTEEGVLQVLRQRFSKRKIYTYISGILVAVNPNRFLPLYYNPKYVKLYENQPLGKLSPHIFAMADVAFRTMLSRQANQCIVISGENGSGKTESSSYLIHCLTTLSQGTYSGGLERAILGAGPVLEAFGNAKTAENNNSSRFGKFIQLIYLESGVIRGAFIEKFLLEKSRLVSRGKNERNYHVFYCLLMGASKDEQKEFHLLNLQDYVYLNQEEFQLDNEDNFKQEYKRLKQAMEMVGLLASTKKRIFSVLSAILLLGNVTYSQSKDTKALEAGPAEVLSSLSDLLMVKKEQLVTALTKKKVVTASSSVVSPYTLQEAFSARDSMAKCLYSALFDWIILHINHAMLNRRDLEESVKCLSIGVLDMFGFENLQRNSFEQLCINYANEKQQFYINQNIFKYEQEDYVSEGIIWQNINFTDNSDCIQLISGKSEGLFHLLNEESNLPQAQDKAVLDKFKRHHQKSSRFVVSHDKEATFAIEHYAGRVEYHVEDFKKKNTEHMRPEVVSLLRSSESSFLRLLVASNPEALFRWGILRATIRIVSVFKKLLRHRAEQLAARQNSRMSLKAIKRQSNPLARVSGTSQSLDFSFDHSDEQSLDLFEDIFVNYEKRKKNTGSRQKQIIPKNLMNLSSLRHIVGLTNHDRTSKSIFHPDRRVDPLTVSAQFQTSLGKLIETIERAEPFFIFCFRSNAEKKQLHFDDEVVLNQIRYMGILQMIHMQKSSYEVKYTFKEFVKKFRILFPKESTGSVEDITKLFEKMGLDKTTYQIGKTKVFLKEKERQLLQSTLNKEVIKHIVTLQRWFRSCLIRAHFLQKRDATKIIQRSWREFYEKQNRTATVIQTAWRTSLSKSLDLSPEPDEDPNAEHGVSSEKRQLRRQQHLDYRFASKPDPVDDQKTQEDQSKQTEEGRGSVPHLNRPFSVPLDATAGSNPSICSSLQQYIGKESATDRTSAGSCSDSSSPEASRRRDDFCRKGKTKSADELSESSSGERSRGAKPERVRLRKPKKHKRRLAHARSGLVYNFGGSKESEYWDFPLPPFSPALPSLKSSASSMDVWALKSQVEFPSEPDCSRYSLPAGGTSTETDFRGSKQSQITTPDRPWFLSKFLKKRAQRSAVPGESLADKTVTLPRFSPQYSHTTNSNNAKVHRSPTVCISRATRALPADGSLDREITNPNELRNLDEFLGNQVTELQTRIKELSATENIFICATMEFRETIKSMYSLQKPQVCYKSLMNGYRNKVNALAGLSNKSEVSLVVNLFQSMLDGFIRGEIKRVESEPAKSTKTTKKRWKNEKCLDNPLDHLFSTYQVNIMQSCDLCGSYIWGMEKAYMCSACKLICHKKCLNKIITDCSTRCARQDDSVPGSLHFGVQVCVLTSKANPVPKVMELLLMHVELNGLYTEGIYRKSGAACRARELHQILQTNPETACLDNYPIHTISGLVKRWLRELPDPLMTFSLYNDFLHAVELPEKPERIRAVYQKVDELPSANYNTLERLIFHLVKVAKEEKHNKMSPSSLAIVFAPCILRSPDLSDPFLCMKDVPKTTLCVEILINEQLRRYNQKMQDIQKLEYAEAQAVNKLKLRRQNTVFETPSELEVPHTGQPDESDYNIIERIKSIKQEKVDLAVRLPELEQDSSDCEVLDSASSVSSDSLDQLGSVDSEGKLSKLSKVLRPECPSKPADLGQRIRSRLAPTPTKQAELTSGQNADVTQSTSPLPGQDTPASEEKQLQVNRKTFNGSFDDLDIPYIDEAVD
ncbi:unconventional myosin-IXb [Fundulus heteroclitus]|uniref:unconventional myosin-IXb n=1 Tax=Fundulus heteroclitus TaxID=8078 RepID=UPI00165A518C|nr:unconventional myosin-IXb [Fundulus heteroclitus]